MKKRRKVQLITLMLVRVNSGFANRCCVCGSCFDQDGICNNGHQKGYPMPTSK